VPGEPLAPRRGIPSGRGPRTTCWRQGSGADGLPFICPFPSAIAEGRRLALPTLSGGGALIAVPVGTAPAPHTIPVGMVRVHPPAATPNVRDPFRVAGEGPGATTHPRTPAPINVNWVLRDSDPGVRLRLWAPFSRLLTSSPFRPSSVYRESLGHSLSRSAPSAPPIRDSPAAPASWGYGRAPIPAAPYSGGERWISLSIAPQGQLPSDQERSRSATPLIREATTRRCRAGFRRRSQFLS
jgi:hypothetical protein